MSGSDWNLSRNNFPFKEITERPREMFLLLKLALVLVYLCHTYSFRLQTRPFSASGKLCCTPDSAPDGEEASEENEYREFNFETGLVTRKRKGKASVVGRDRRDELPFEVVEKVPMEVVERVSSSSSSSSSSSKDKRRHRINSSIEDEGIARLGTFLLAPSVSCGDLLELGELEQGCDRSGSDDAFFSVKKVKFIYRWSGTRFRVVGKRLTVERLPSNPYGKVDGAGVLQ
jgi:hypothetical protein